MPLTSEIGQCKPADILAFNAEFWGVVFDVGCVVFDVRCVVFDVGCVVFDVGCVVFDVGCVVFEEISSDARHIVTGKQIGRAHV